MSAKSSKNDPPRKPWPRYRSAHRKKSDDQAHAESENPDAESNVPIEPFKHPSVFEGDPQLVDSTPALLELIERLRCAGSFGYDSEFIGEQSYYPQLCVIQVATIDSVALIDPLPPSDHTEGLNITPFWELIADPEVRKIVHAGLPDLEPVARHLGRPPQSIFDTQIAAAFADLPYPMALGKLLHEVIGVDLMRDNRGMKFSQWDRRPLSPSQLQYAASDVRYLPLLQQQLQEQIESFGNSAAAADEFQSLSQLDLYVVDPQSQRVRVRGVDRLSRHKRAVLRALVAWRNAAAREHNVPTRSLLRDEVLYSLASSPPLSKQDLKAIAGLPRPVEREYADAIVEATRLALEAPIEDEQTPEAVQMDRPRRRPPLLQDRKTHRERIDEVWTQIEARCQQRHIHPGVVTSKRELDRVLGAIEKGNLAPAEDLLTGWRRELLKDILDDVLKRK